MIDQEKVAVMTEAAIEEKHNRRTAFPAANYYMYDYVSVQVLKGLFGVTLIFLILAACWLFYTMEDWISSYSLVQMIHLFTRIAVVYGLVMAGMAVLLILTYSVRYIQSNRAVKEQYRGLKRLERYYDLEDRKRGD